MKIVSPQVDAPISVTPVADSSASIPTEAGTDFSKLLTDTLPPADLSENPAVDLPVNLPTVKAEAAKTDETDSTQPPNFAYDMQLLQALQTQIHAAMQTPPPVTPPPVTPEVIETITKAVVSTATVVQNTLPNANANANTNTKGNLPVTNTVIAPLAQTAETEDAELPVLTDNNKMTAANGNMTPPVLPDHHTKTQLTSDFAANQQEIVAALSTEPLLTQPSQPLQQENKFTNALTELGQLINNHTAQHANPDVGQSNNIYTNTTDSLKNIARPEFEPRIELPSVVLNSLNQETYNANIKIYPPELGRVMAKLKVDKNNAELMILTENNVVKQIIETNLPELRQNFQNADITLTSINVQTAADNASGSEDHRNSQSNQTDAESGSDLPGAAALAEPITARTIDSIIDTYA